MSKLLDMWADMTGVVMDYALKTPPSAGWMLCYGQALTTGTSATARLRAKLIADDFPFGQDGSGNPLVPDARGRVTAGIDNMGGAAADRLTPAGSGINGAYLGGSGGAQTHTLAATHLPAHAHTATIASGGGHSHTASTDSQGSHGHTGTTDAQGVHTHSIYAPYMGNLQHDGTDEGDRTVNGAGYSSESGAAGNHWHNLSINAAGAHGHNITVAAAAAHTHTITVNETGSGQAHNNTQPTLILNKIIKL